MRDEPARLSRINIPFQCPEDESALGHAELSGNAGKRDSLGAQLNELLYSFLVYHKVPFRLEHARGNPNPESPTANSSAIRGHTGPRTGC